MFSNVYHLFEQLDLDFVCGNACSNGRVKRTLFSPLYPIKSNNAGKCTSNFESSQAYSLK